MGHRLINTLCGLGVVCLLAFGMFLCGKRPESKSLTCTDLLDMPLEELMEVRIVSHSNDRPSGQTPNSPYPPILLNTPWYDLMQVPIVCTNTSASFQPGPPPLSGPRCLACPSSR